MDESAIAVAELRVERGGCEVIKGISFGVGRGTVTGLLGPNGCGKTTLMRAIVGVQVVASGTVTVLGHPAGSPVLRDLVGYATQQPAVYPDLTVRECLRYFASVLRSSPATVDEAIERVGLTGSADVLIGRLSGGQQARANLAVALLGTPKLLVLDEPTVGSDPVLRDELWRMFGSLAAAGTTVLISSHVMDEAARCERLLLMREGLLLADGTPQELRDRTGTPDLERAFLTLTKTSEVPS